MSKAHIQEEEEQLFFRFRKKYLQGRGSKPIKILYSCCCDMKLDHGCFGFSKESLKVEIFFSAFLVPLYQGI